MKAVLCKAFGPPESLVVEDIDEPQARAGQVIVEVYSCGVNFPDVLMMQNKYQFKPPLPFSPGSEVAGIVTALGDGVTNLKVGDRVIASTGSGGMVERIAADAARCTAIPKEMDFDTASGFLVNYTTSHHALKDRAKIQPGESLFVMGAAGGVGLAAVELGKVMGARVIAGASTQEKVDVAIAHGADTGLIYPTGKLTRDQQKAFSAQIKEAAGAEGADVIYDPVGDDYAEPALRATNWDGRYLVIGFAAGEIPRVPLNLALLKGCQIVGVFLGSFSARYPDLHRKNVEELMDWYVAGKLKPLVSAAYPMDNAAQALIDIAERKAKGKVVVRIKDE
jgi:NADPH2:quinone reductase